MKKPIVALTLIASSLLAGLFACQKYSSGNSAPLGNNIPPETMVTASLKGRVTDQNGVPVQGAFVTSGTASTSTDVNGIFSFANISMSSRFGFVKATKGGYFTGSRSIIANAGESNFVTIQLINRAESGNFQASSGGKIMVYSGDTVTFNPSSLVIAANNSLYVGTVHVFATYLNPTNDDLFKYMPGDLRGIGSDGKETALQTFGMMDVELQDDAGNKLQLVTGQNATLTFAIPSSLQSAAPSSIPLWYFNDSSGRWIQQGTATRQGNNYIGQVSHFTYWNCDLPFSTVNYKVRLKDQFGNPLAYTHIYFNQNGYIYSPTFTDSTGFASGIIPKGQSLVMEVVTECGNVLAGANVGPALSDQEMGTVTVTISYSDLTLTGKVVNCSGQPVDSGYVTATIDGLNYRATVSKGAYTLPVMRCYSGAASVNLAAYDLVALQRSGNATITATSGTVDAGTLSACQTAYTQFLNFSYHGYTGTYTNPPDTVFMHYDQSGYLNIIGESRVNGTYVTTTDIALDAASHGGTYGLGTYMANWFAYQNNSSGQSFNAISASMGITITQYDSVGGYIVGKLGGTLQPYDSVAQVSYPLSGSFKVLRTQ